MNTLTFDRENLHIVSNSTINFAHQYGYQPLATGNTLPHFYLPSQHAIAQHFASGLSTRETVISLQDLLDYQQPLVIAFLGAPGQAAASIPQLEKLHTTIQNQGGRLLILTAIQPKHLRKQLQQSNLTIFYDKDNAIAELFGLYDVQNPLWQWVSGIEDEEQSIPALYVIAPDRNIIFSYVDYTFSLFTGSRYASEVINKELLSSVYAVSAQYHYQPETYKLVS